MALLLLLIPVCVLIVLIALSGEDIGGACQWQILPGIYIRQYVGLPFAPPFGGREWVGLGWLLVHTDDHLLFVYAREHLHYTVGAIVEDAATHTWTLVLRD